MNRIKIWGWFLLMIILLMSCGEQNGATQLYLAHSLPTSHPVHLGIEDFRDELSRRSGGQVSVKIFPDGQLGTEREVLELLQIGSIGMTKVSAAVLANFAPEYSVLGLPYLFRNKEHMFGVLESEIGQGLLEAGSDYWLRGLCFYDAGSRSFYTVDKAVRTPDDLKALKIRVMNHQMSVDMVNAFGASATPLDFGELYTAMQQGVVDGAENNPPSFVSSHHYEVCKYYTLDEHNSVPDVLVIGTKFWNKLTAEQQLWVQESAAASVVSQKRYWEESVDECMEILEKAGVEIIRPEKSLFAAKAKEIRNKYINTEELKSLVSLIENFQPEVEE